ncbi:MAG: molybdate ABC transporter substrate-binding protein [Thermomicrobiales bacterium]
MSGRDTRLRDRFAFVTVLLLAGMSFGWSSGAAREQPTLTVAAAADLTIAFEEIGKRFEDETGVRIDFMFGSTGQITQQIQAGAPVDVFAAASVSYIDQLREQGLILEDTQALYARGQIVIWARSDSDIVITSLDQLTDDAIERVAIANPDHAPYGAAARDALISAGVWEQIQDKLILGENISDTLRYGTTGNVDVAIVALSLAIPSDGQWTIVPQEHYPPIDQALAVIAETDHEEEARAFALFVNSEAGREIMREFGFLLPGESFASATPVASPSA